MHIVHIRTHIRTHTHYKIDPIAHGRKYTGRRGAQERLTIAQEHMFSLWTKREARVCSLGSGHTQPPLGDSPIEAKGQPGP